MKKLKSRFVAFAVLGGTLAAAGLACAASAGDAGTPGGKVHLPAAAKKSGMDLFEALGGRHSSRSYDPKRAIPDKTLANVLWAADGVNRPNGKHTAPSARGVRYMRIYVCRADGAWRYDQDKHVLIKVTGADLRARVGRQKFMADAPVVVVLTSDLAVYRRRVPGARESAIREYSHATAGCIAQNIYLSAEASGLGTVMAAMIRADEIRKGLKFGKDELPMYIMPLGYVR